MQDLFHFGATSNENVFFGVRTKGSDFRRNTAQRAKKKGSKMPILYSTSEAYRQRELCGRLPSVQLKFTLMSSQKHVNLGNGSTENLGASKTKLCLFESLEIHCSGQTKSLLR